jgi:hypothetical protein
VGGGGSQRKKSPDTRLPLKKKTRRAPTWLVGSSGAKKIPGLVILFLDFFVDFFAKTFRHCFFAKRSLICPWSWQKNATQRLALKFWMCEGASYLSF